MDPRVVKLAMIAVLAVGLGAGCCQRQRISPQAEPAASLVTDPRPGELQVYLTSDYAASMSDLIELFGERRPNVTFEQHSGDTSSLVARMLDGARPDVFIAAGDTEVNPLRQADLVSLQQDVCFITLGIITPQGNPAGLTSLQDLTAHSTRTVAIAPADTSIGCYARELLKEEGLWESIEGKVIVPSLSSEVLDLVAEGEADVCLAYGAALRQKANDAGQYLRSKLELVKDLTAEYCVKIPCPAVSLVDCAHPETAAEFIDFLTSEDAQEVLARHGFLRLKDPCCGPE